MKTYPSTLPGKTLKRFAPLAFAAAAFGITALNGAVAQADWKNDPAAIQHVYLKGVPHTDRNGRPMMQYDADRSFLPISIYHAIEMDDTGVKYRLADLKAAGFTCAIAWPGMGPGVLADLAAKCGLQMIFWAPKPQEVKDYLNHPAILGYVLADEPIGHVGGDIEEVFAGIDKLKNEIKEVDKVHPVFQVDAGWIIPPATDWWIKLNTWGDVSSHDNYPINSKNQSLSLQQGIPETVSLAVSSNKEQKPMWFVPQNFEILHHRFQFTFPTSVEQRCMVYTALIHGATGIIHFSLDSFVTRDGRVVGISPNPIAKYHAGMVATNSQLRQSKDMWDATVALNGELNQLRPALLSPTADIPYEIALDDKWAPVTPSPIRTLLKRNPAGGYVLLLANVDAAPQHAQVRFAGKKYKLTELFNPPGASLFKRQGDAFEFVAAPYDVRVFQIDMQ
jgi:hypothetical protein